ncbi:MAG TPA: DNA mismatch repair protein MutL, partial [Chthoniobacterales bacterium]
VVFQVPATASLRERVRDLYGSELVERLVEVEASGKRGKPEISGLIGQAGVARQTRSQQLVFVNGRAIESPVLNAALREGYHTTLMKGQYPVTFLFLRLDPAAVDVNVHPAKREVRFRDPSSVREAVVEAVRRTLEGGRREWQEQFRAPAVAGVVDPGPRSAPALENTVYPQPRVEPASPMPATAPLIPPAANETITVEQNHTSAPGSSRDQQFQIIGVLNRLYVLMENANGLVLVDQHAAHERILFEELRRRMEEQGVPSQRLLMPVTFDLAPRDAEWVERNLATLEKMGIGIEPFGAQTFRIDSLPTFLTASDPVRFMREVIDGLRSASNSTSALRLGEDMIAKTVCRHAVKANDPLRHPEIEKLIVDLLACELPYCCPHGRPTMIHISHGELEKKFGRKV